MSTATSENLIEVIDAHQHVGEAMAVGGGENLAGYGLDLSEEELTHRTDLMRAAGVRQAIVIPGHKYLRPNGLADTRAVNDAIAAYVARDPSTFPAALGVIEPRDGPFAIPEITRIKEELGLKGVSIHCRFQGVGLDNGWIVRYIEAMAPLGLVPFVHVVHESVDEAMWKLCALAHQIPDVTFVALDGFGAFDGARHCFHAAEMHPNIVFDTALAFQWEMVEGFVRRFGAHRVIFGTDTYSYRQMPHVLKDILGSSLTDADKAAIVGGNVRRLLDLS